MKKLIIFYLILINLLTGCVGVIVAGTAASLLVYDRRSIFTIESDTRIFYIINKAIVTNPDFNNSRVVITSFNGIVLLTGQLSDPTLTNIAEKIVYNTPNVQRLYNQTTIEKPISLAQQGKDALYTSKLRGLMLAQKGLESGSIRIVTENNTIYLMGIVTPNQARIAVKLAKQINGVHKIVKIFRYIN